MPQPNAIDIPFSVPFVHRLRFTDDVFGADQQVLADALEPSQGQPARVQFWIDSNVAACHHDLRDHIAAFLETMGDRVVPIGLPEIVPGGETVKNDIHLLEGMLKQLNAASMDRRSYMVAIGGGSVLDTVGFVAGIAHRGLRLIRIPTTTLSQGDSGIGVKNGVNLFHKKNWLGTFAVPWAVINDTTLLQTLPDRDFACGFSEAVKVALLKDPAMFAELCEHAEAIRQRDMTRALPMIERSARLHLDHITQSGDPFEMLAARPLDFGHWSAHRLESLSNFQLRHGEAVALGVAIDSMYSSLELGLPEEDAHRIVRCLKSYGLCVDDLRLLQPEPLFEGLEEFRQHLGGRLTLTMLRAVGDPIDVHEVNLPRMQLAIERVAAYTRIA